MYTIRTLPAWADPPLAPGVAQAALFCGHRQNGGGGRACAASRSGQALPRAGRVSGMAGLLPPVFFAQGLPATPLCGLMNRCCMGERKGCRALPAAFGGQKPMARLFALVLAAITAVSVALLAMHVWWFPVDIAAHGPAIDHQFSVTFIVMGTLFISAQLGLAYLVWRHRDRDDGRKAVYSRGKNKLEFISMTAAAILFIGLEFMGHRIWDRMHYTGAQPDALRIEVWGQQFAWYFRYPGPDGRFGPVHPALMDDSMGNYLGLDRRHDPASRDDIVTATLGIPASRPVELILRSKDVIHSFFVPELRIKQDLVPGMEIPIHFTATKQAFDEDGGRYEIVCAQLCGMGHYRMRAFLQIMTEKNFKKWLQRQAAMQ